jgi:hypothetical protein
LGWYIQQEIDAADRWEESLDGWKSSKTSDSNRYEKDSKETGLALLEPGDSDEDDAEDNDTIALEESEPVDSELHTEGQLFFHEGSSLDQVPRYRVLYRAVENAQYEIDWQTGLRTLVIPATEQAIWGDNPFLRLQNPLFRQADGRAWVVDIKKFPDHSVWVYTKITDIPSQDNTIEIYDRPEGILVHRGKHFWGLSSIQEILKRKAKKSFVCERFLSGLPMGLEERL